MLESFALIHPDFCRIEQDLSYNNGVPMKPLVSHTSLGALEAYILPFQVY